MTERRTETCSKTERGMILLPILHHFLCITSWDELPEKAERWWGRETSCAISCPGLHIAPTACDRGPCRWSWGTQPGKAHVSQTCDSGSGKHTCGVTQTGSRRVGEWVGRPGSGAQLCPWTPGAERTRCRGSGHSWFPVCGLSRAPCSRLEWDLGCVSSQTYLLHYAPVSSCTGRARNHTAALELWDMTGQWISTQSHTDSCITRAIHHPQAEIDNNVSVFRGGRKLCRCTLI